MDKIISLLVKLLKVFRKFIVKFGVKLPWISPKTCLPVLLRANLQKKNSSDLDYMLILLILKKPKQLSYVL